MYFTCSRVFVCRCVLGSFCRLLDGVCRIHGVVECNVGKCVASGMVL